MCQRSCGLTKVFGTDLVVEDIKDKACVGVGRTETQCHIGNREPSQPKLELKGPIRAVLVV